MRARVSVDHPIDINVVSLESLRDGVVGFGPVLAGRVVAYREEHGPFASVSELANVRGIGPQLLARIAGQVTVGGAHLPVLEATEADGASAERGCLDAKGMAEDLNAERARGELPAKEADLGVPASPRASLGGERGMVRRDSFWQRLWPILLGGSLGMVLTLLIMLVISGTLHFAPQREMAALSRNLGVMRSEQEVSRERIEQLTTRVGELERQVRRLEGLSARVASLESDLAATRDDVEKLARAFEALRGEVTQELSRLDRRVTEMQGTVKRVQERIRRFDAFFVSLRDLLDEMESVTNPESGVKPTPQ